LFELDKDGSIPLKLVMEMLKNNILHYLHI